MEKTHSKYTVEVHCNKHDIMVDEEVLAEEDHDSFSIAEKQHEDECSGAFLNSCSAEAWQFRDGWEDSNLNKLEEGA